MFIGCNYSKELMQLIEEERVKVDYIKLALYDYFKEGFTTSLAKRPVLIHGVAPGVPERVGIPLHMTERIDWERIRRNLEKYQSPHLGVHLDSKKSDWSDSVLDRDVLVERLIAGTKVWAREIQLPLLVENVPYTDYYGSKGAIEEVTAPEVISTVCVEAKVGLLLDISHARVAAWHRKEDIYSYLSQLPLERVREIHVVAPLLTEDTGLRDRHLEMGEIDYQILGWLLERTSPTGITLEYGGPGPHFAWRSDQLALERQLIRMQDFVNG